MIFTNLTLYFESILHSLSAEHRILAYLILFCVIFFETGLFFVPFLPGDSLFFLAGALFSSVSFTEIICLCILISIAAILGDLLNYAIGRFIGKEILLRHWINSRYLEKTHQYFAEYGERTVLLARFVPVVRTLTPFVAGVGKMKLRDFMKYNILGGVIWVFIFLLAGYFFGNIPFVQQNLSSFMIGIIFISIIPLAYFIFGELKKKAR